MSSSTEVAVTLRPLAPGPLGDLAATSGELRFVWCDLDGLHYGRAPDAAPGATHLWGWSAGAALLARLDRSRVVAGVLLRREAGGVPVTVRRLVAWRRPADQHVTELPTELAGLSLVTLEVPGPLELLAEHDGWWPR